MFLYVLTPITRMKRRSLLAITLLLAVLLSSSLAAAATLSGMIYTEELELAQDVLVEIDTQPQQRLLSRDGTYAFELPPGNYTLTLTYPTGETNETTIEHVVVRQEGGFIFDMFLFPTFAEEELLYEEIGEVEDLPDLDGERSIFWQLFILSLILLLLFLILLFHHRRKRFGAEDDRVEEILAIIRKEGGRISQKELRKRLPESEAKVSLLIAELEAKGRIEKIKKGRGNILVLKR